jgi:hypothetical protein
LKGGKHPGIFGCAYQPDQAVYEGASVIADKLSKNGELKCRAPTSRSLTLTKRGPQTTDSRSSASSDLKELALVPVTLQKDHDRFERLPII